MTRFDQLKRAVELVLALHDQAKPFPGFRLDPKAEEQLRGAARDADLMQLQDLSASIDSVLLFLGNRKPLAIAGLFSGADESYREEWLGRDPFTFWCNLDLTHRRQLIAMATSYYAGGE